MIDSHMHILSLENKDDVVRTMKDDGLFAMVTIGTTINDSKENIKFANKHEGVYVAVGIYPEYANDVSDDDLKEIEQLAKNKKVVAIGEIGLDYHNVGFNKEKQIEIFEKQLQIADRLGLPFCIHCRMAVEDMYKVLLKNKHLINHSGIMHCYSEGKEWVEKFLNLGLYISFSGNITFKKVDREVLKMVPLDRILVETDAPYLSPEPLRGKINEPKNVKYIIEKIAKELNLSYDELEKITEKNAKKVYFL